MAILLKSTLPPPPGPRTKFSCHFHAGYCSLGFIRSPSLGSAECVH